MGGAPTLAALTQEIVACRRCPRLVTFRERVAKERKKAYAQETYWGRPVPGFGDPMARLVVVGLAPAAHGSNRTGRVFTGDRSAAFLVRALCAAGYANQPTSERRGDGLRYTDAWVTAAVRCVPPDNRPLPSEWAACRGYLERELALLPRTRAYLALGAFAFDSTLAAAAAVHGVPVPRSTFAHGACVPLGPGKPLVFASFHPSPQNTNTGRLTAAMFASLLEVVRASYGESPRSGNVNPRDLSRARG